MFSLRHPEPNLIDKTQLTCPEVQVHGTWEKLPSRAQRLRPIGRCSHSSWVWKSRLYIGYGIGDGYQEVKDMWYEFEPVIFFFRHNHSVAYIGILI
jgi:hypothetical protein